MSSSRTTMMRPGSPGHRPSGPSPVLSGLGFVVVLLLAGGLGAWLGSRSGQERLASTTTQQPTFSAPDQTSAQEGAAPQCPELLLNGRQMIPIIMYHDVVPHKQVWFDLTTSEFARQMAQLSAAGAHAVTLQAAYDHLATGKPLPDRPVVLTFDDCTLGQFTQALPILKRHRFPATFFVQTAYVGTTTGKEHMTWRQLKQAQATGLISVESHTVTHPEDITRLSDEALDREMQVSRQTIEDNLGTDVNFLAYPSGNCDARVGESALKAGYLAAVTMDRGWACSPAQSFFLPRFAPERVNDIIDVWNGAKEMAPPAPRLIAIQDAPVTMGTYDNGPVPVQWVAGGDLASESLNTRYTVGEMALAAHAPAALNGTFFADARVASQGSAMVGPVYSRIGAVYRPDTPSEEDRIQGRPLVLMGDHRCLVVPFYPHLGHSLDELKFILPDVKDAFLAGGWIVHFGKALSPNEMATWSSKDYNDPRHRAFVGVDKQGRYILGATQDSVGSRVLAKALEMAGVQEAWLLDSGFSTSLIWQNRVLVSGHSRKGVPSRPVPHALFLLGPIAPDAPPPPADSPLAAGGDAPTAQDAMAADSTAGAAHYRVRHRRRHVRRRRHQPPTPASLGMGDSTTLSGDASGGATGAPPQ